MAQLEFPVKLYSLSFLNPLPPAAAHLQLRKLQLCSAPVRLPCRQLAVQQGQPLLQQATAAAGSAELSLQAADLHLPQA